MLSIYNVYLCVVRICIRIYIYILYISIRDTSPGCETAWRGRGCPTTTLPHSSAWRPRDTGVSLASSADQHFVEEK